VRSHRANYHTPMLSAERQRKKLAGLDEASEGFKLFPDLEVHEDDLRIKKIKYSAFAPASSDMTRSSTAAALTRYSLVAP
jgi:hypothetical protein